MSYFDYSSLSRKIVRQCLSADGRQSIRSTSIFDRNCFNQARSLESCKRLIQGARRYFNTREISDVFHECVSVLLAAGKTREN